MSSVAALFQMAGRSLATRVLWQELFILRYWAAPDPSSIAAIFFSNLGDFESSPLGIFRQSVAYWSSFHAGNPSGHGCYFGCGADRVCAMAIKIQRLEIRHLRISTHREQKKSQTRELL
jgi:hypothetical protein